MARAKTHGALSVRSRPRPRALSFSNASIVTPPTSTISTSTTPQTSAYPSACPSAYPSDDEMSEEPKKKKEPFPFLSLPSELRNQIYAHVFGPCPDILDLDPYTFAIIQRRKLLSIFRVCRQIYYEASHHFYSTHTFRVFPTFPGKQINSKKPLLARLAPRKRISITTLELRLGPGWHSPPRGWIVNKTLGLSDCQSVRVLKVFVECDPSDGIYKGFRRSDGFYEGFCQELLDSVLQAIPSIKFVEFDGWESVKKNGAMIEGLTEVAGRHERCISWGPERRWDRDDERERGTPVPKVGTCMVISRSVAVAA